MKLALYKGKGQIGNYAIRAWTRYAYSHCEIVIDNLWYSSSIMDKGVRVKHINPDSGHWDFIELPDRLAQRVLEYFNKTEGDAYGWGSLISSQIFNRNSTEPKAAFCSSWCASALGLPNPSSYSPGSLARLVEWLLKEGYTFADSE